MGEYQLTCSPHLFDLGGPDVVLGIEWLKTLGDTIANWSKHTLSFWSGIQWVRLQGVSSGKDPTVALQSILSKTGRMGPGVLRSIGQAHPTEIDPPQLSATQQEELQSMLSKYAEVGTRNTASTLRRAMGQ